MRTEGSAFFNVAYATWYHGGAANAKAKAADAKAKVPGKAPAPAKAKAAANGNGDNAGDPEVPPAKAGGTPGVASLASLLSGIVE